jgi:hypothetical protein
MVAYLVIGIFRGPLDGRKRDWIALDAKKAALQARLAINGRGSTPHHRRRAKARERKRRTMVRPFSMRRKMIKTARKVNGP